MQLPGLLPSCRVLFMTLSCSPDVAAVLLFCFRFVSAFLLPLKGRKKAEKPLQHRSDSIARASDGGEVEQSFWGHGICEYQELRF